MSLVKIEVEFPDFLGALIRNEERIALVMAATVQANRGMMFDKEGAHNGKEKWAPLKFRNGQILSKSGTLRKSWAPTNPRGVAGPGGLVEISGGLQNKMIKVGTRVAYAAIHNYGGKIVARGKALAFEVDAKYVARKHNASLTSENIHEKGTMNAKRARKKMRTKKSEDGADIMFRRSVNIPQRRMDEWNAEDQAELTITLHNLVAEILNGG